MSGRAIAGILLIVIGLGFVLEQLEVVDFGELLNIFWPLGLVLLGVLNLVMRAPGPGVLLVLAGALLQLWVLGYLPSAAWHYAWPLGLVGIGVWLLWFSKRGPKLSRSSSGNRLNQFVTLGSVEINNEAPAFQGGEVTAVLGAAELDLRGATLEAERAELSVTAILGAIEIRVPEGWQVNAGGTNLLGAFEKKTHDPRQGDGPAPQLDVHGFSLFGAVEIRN